MKIKEKEFNVTSGEETITEREETTAEIKIRTEFETKVKADKAEAETKALAKSALLAKLGITEDEAQLLLS
jgi:hypothetical protein